MRAQNGRSFSCRTPAAAAPLDIIGHNANFLGTYDSIEEAAAARKSAEALLFGETAAFIQKWKESAAKNPEWAGNNPVEIHVSRDRDGRLAVSYSPQIL